MPTYLCHGFRWHRKSIRYFVVIQNIDDAAPEWIVAPGSALGLLEQFYELFDFLPASAPPPSAAELEYQKHAYANSYDSHNDPYRHHENDELRGRYDDGGSGGGRRRSSKSRSRSRKRSKSRSRRPKTRARDEPRELPPPMPPPPPPPPPPPLLPPPDEDLLFNDWSPVKFLEEYDPTNLSVVSGPWAYVADHVVRVDTSISIAEEIGRYEAQVKTEKDKPISGPSDETGRRVNTVGSKKAGWFEKLRDQLQRGESIRWYVVVCEDEERNKGGGRVDDDDDDDDHNLRERREDEEDEDEEDEVEEYVLELSRARGQERERPRMRTPAPPIRGIVEHGFEFRIPELAGFTTTSRAAPSSAARRRPEPPRGPPPPPPQQAPPPPPPLQQQHQHHHQQQHRAAPMLLEKDVPVIPPPPHPFQVAGKMSMDAPAVRPKTPKSSSGGLRRLFSKRSADGGV
ncbi:hypothetical protein F4778DRAFT_355991 [Xylariomycetidae sp. FL2044]|nr:hypothetical protein F4778DRAFT_355991 [Xylariomycetidae sp. FL2044]